MPEKVHKNFNEAEKHQTSLHQTVIQPSKASIATSGPKRLSDGKVKSSESSRESLPAHTQLEAHTDRSKKQKKVYTHDGGNGKDELDFSDGTQKWQKFKVNRTKTPFEHKTSSTSQQTEAARLFKDRQSLPIWPKRRDIQQALRKSDCLLLIGETGSGKSTQVPQFLYIEPWCRRKTVKIKDHALGEKQVSVGGMIAVTEPRRIATQTLSRRVDRELVLSPGNSNQKNPARVGYSVRFASNIPHGTRIKFLTEGMLLQEMIKDPHLRQYSAVIVDEIHERSVDVDLIAGFLRRMVHGDKSQRGGIPLKVVIMSATLDLGGLESFFAKPGTVPDYQPGKNYGSKLGHRLQRGQQMMDAAPKRDEYSKSGDMAVSNANKSKSLAPNGEQEPPPISPSRKGSGTADSTSSSWSGCSSSKDENAKENDDPSSSASSPKRDASDPDVPVTIKGVAIEYVEGRQYGVEVFHENEPQTDYLDAMLKKILYVHTSEPLPGDILAFLTGQEEIMSLRTQLEYHAAQLSKSVPKFKVMPLYGSLPAQDQQEAFEKVKEKNSRKIVLATNIAETSVTVSGVRYVIDSGKAKVKQYRPSHGMESLLVKPISRVSATQRKGRAGREAPGKCWRLYTQSDYLNMELEEPPEILRADVVEAVLKMKARGVDDIFEFPLMDSPNGAAMCRALLQLAMLGALDETGKLTDTGRIMSAYPLPATFGKVLIAAAAPDSDCLLEAIDVIACITAESEIFLQAKTEEEQHQIDEYRQELSRREGDILTYLTTMQCYAAETSDLREWCRKRFVSFSAMKNAMAVRKQLQRICLSQKLLKEAVPSSPQTFEPTSPERAEVLLKAFMKAFASKTATLGPQGNYIITQGRSTISVHPSSVLHGKRKEAIMFLDHVYTTKSYAKVVSAIQSTWIAESFFG